MNDFCEYCGSEFKRWSWDDRKKFCDDKCRVNWHNESRKINRQMITINRALDTLHEILIDSSMQGLHDTVIKHLNDIRVDSRARYGLAEVRCMKCGHRAKMPVAGAKFECWNCQSSFYEYDRHWAHKS